MTKDTANEVVEAFATMLTMTDQASVEMTRRGGRTAAYFRPRGAARGRAVSLAVDTIGRTGFSVAPIENGMIVEDEVEITSSIATLPHLLSRAFGWARTVRKNRRTSR